MQRVYEMYSLTEDNWKQHLDENELHHLTELDVYTLYELLSHISEQNEARPELGDEACETCKVIATKLNLLEI